MFEINDKGELFGATKEEIELIQKYRHPIPQSISRYATPKRIVIRDYLNSIDVSNSFSRYTKEQISTYLKAPDRNEKNLRDMSIFLYNISNQYKRLIHYFSKMAVFAYIIAPLSLDTPNGSKKLNDKNILLQYNKVKKYLSNMNIAHEFGQAMTVVFREDVFYGYIWETQDSWSLQKLSANYCRLAQRIDGCWGFEFDFQYFQGKEKLLETYPAEFQTKFAAYQNDNKLKWQILEDKNTICLKFHEDLNYCLPPFATLLSDIADIQDYKDLAKTSTEMENYKLLHLELQYNEDGSPIIDGALAEEYYEQFGNALPDNIGAAMSPFKVTDFKFDKANASRGNDVRESEEAYWRNAGVNSLLMGGGERPSAAAVRLGVTVDELMVFGMLRQIERNINRLLKNFSGTQKFNIAILDVTYFNKNEYLNTLLKCGMYGMPVRSVINSIIGISATNLEGILYLENQLLDLSSKEKPFISSNVQSGDGGKPTDASNGEVVDDSGERTIENDSNNI